jgi:hypothetical protein
MSSNQPKIADPDQPLSRIIIPDIITVVSKAVNYKPKEYEIIDKIINDVGVNEVTSFSNEDFGIQLDMTLFNGNQTPTMINPLVIEGTTYENAVSGMTIPSTYEEAFTNLNKISAVKTGKANNYYSVSELTSIAENLKIPIPRGTKKTQLAVMIKEAVLKWKGLA